MPAARMRSVTFLKSAGPFTLSGSDAKKIYSGWGAAEPLAVSNATFGTLSRFPIKVTAKTSNYDAYCSLVADTPSYLELTGGVVQGMSGSPIIQNGRLVGAVTHVFVSDPSSGYGIGIYDMLDAAGKCA